MASVVNCELNYYKHYNGKWSTWWNTLYSGGYAGTDYCVVVRFITPDFSDTSSELDICFPYVRSEGDSGNTPATSGTFYFKIYDKDPTTGTLKNALPTDKNCDARGTWSSSDLEIHQFSGTIQISSMKPNRTYYLAIGSSKTVQVGYDSSAAKKLWGVDLWYYTSIQKGSVTITDNLNNSYTVTAKTPVSPNNNRIRSNVLTYYRLKATGAADEITEQLQSNYEFIDTIEFTPTDNSNTRLVTAMLDTTGTHQSPSRAQDSKYIKCYVAPSVPGRPVISNTKVTITDSVTYTWTAATKNNNTSPVRGYRVRIFKNGSEIVGLAKSGVNDIIKADTNARWVDFGSNILSVSFDLSNLGFSAEDTVSVGVYSYTLNGKGTRIFSTNQVKSGLSTIENDTVFHVKVNGQWEAGEVYAKVDGQWKKAKSLYAKVDGKWKSTK